MTNNPLMDLRRLDEEKRRKNVSDTDPAQDPALETNVTTLQGYNVTSDERSMQETLNSSQQEKRVATKARGRRAKTFRKQQDAFPCKRGRERNAAVRF